MFATKTEFFRGDSKEYILVPRGVYILFGDSMALFKYRPIRH